MARPAPDPAFLDLTGQRPRPSRAKAGEPEPATGGRPKIPRHVREDEDAYEEWKRVVKLLDGRQTLTRGDAPLIELHCLTYARLRRCWAEIRERGQFEDSIDGRVESAASKLGTKLSAQLRQTQIQLGLTPQARNKVTRTVPDPKQAPPPPGSLRDLLRQAAEIADELPEKPQEPVEDVDELLDEDFTHLTEEKI
jgi:P27 family predicted phage terminase small subunit